MRILRHNSYVASRKRRAKLMALAGFLALTGTLFLALLPNFLLPSYIVMLVAFVLFNLGMQQIGKWTRNPRNDQILDHQMKALPDRYSLIHYAPIGKDRVEHVLVHPGGLLVMTAREIDGKIDVKANRWKRRSSGFRRFFTFSGPQLGNPGLETDRAVGALETFLAEEQLEVDVEGCVVFLHPQTELDVEEPEFPILHGDELPQFITDLPADATFTTRERDRVVELLGVGEIPDTQRAPVRRRPVKRRTA
ncbi:MAG: NERD domain-containing protein [Chloroflexota bacterium]|nr:NERD domain-containing protein [Chloroflexota bacterium]